MATINKIEIPVIKVRQTIGDLFIGVMKARDLYDIARVDRIRLEQLEIPKYAGFQRALVSERVKAIQAYLSEPQATFPNALIVSLDSEYIESWEDVPKKDSNHIIADISILNIRREEGAVTIIDGQHRAAALDAAPESFMVIVCIFVDLELVQQAQIFAKINSTQKAVNPSIAFQLFGYAEGRSPQRTAHEIAQTLNTTEGSPFYRRLRMLGTKDDWSIGTLSPSTFCKQLMRLYTKNPQHDENNLLLRKALESYYGHPLRSLFIEGKDDQILRITWRFFYHIAKTWPDQWSVQNIDSILVKTTGYAAFVEVLRAWLLNPRAHEVLQDMGVREALDDIKDRYSCSESRFVRANYPAGNQGVQRLRNGLVRDLGLG